MDQPLELFAGERIVDDVALAFHGGKATLRCSVRERWADCLIAFLRCGNAQTFKLKRVIGVSRRELTTLEDAVTVSLGIEGIAGFNGQLKEHTTSEVGLQESTEEEQEFRFEAPPKGLLAVLVYQMQRVYYIEYEDSRWGRRHNSFRLAITEWLRRFFDDSKRHDQDPHCLGGVTVPEGKAGPDRPRGRLLIDFGPYTLAVDYARTERGLEVPSLDAFVAPRDVGKILSVPGSFGEDVIPDYMRFLAGETRAVPRGQFRAPVGEDLAGLLGNTAESIQVQRVFAEE